MNNVFQNLFGRRRGETTPLSSNQQAEVIVDTLRRVNAALDSDPNAINTTWSGGVEPEKAYVDLVRELVGLSP